MDKKYWEIYNQIMEATAHIEDRELAEKIANEAAQARNSTQIGIIKSVYSGLMSEEYKHKRLNASFGTWREWLIIAGIIALIIII